MDAGGQLEIDSVIMTLTALIKKKKNTLVTQVCERSLTWLE